GQWKNVWLPSPPTLQRVTLFGKELDGVAKAVWHRPQFLGQFWMGVAAWPSAFQYATYDDNKAEGPLFGAYQRQPKDDELKGLQRKGSKGWALGGVFPVIAGARNLLGIYDAFAGPVVLAEDEEKEKEKKPTPPAPAPGGPPK